MFLKLPRFNRPRGTSNCESANPSGSTDLTSHLNTLLSSSGPGYTLSLCPNEEYLLTAPLVFTAPNQEISTAGYPTDSSRAMLVVNGPIYPNGTGHTVAVDGTCNNCESVKLRNVQINGTRLGAPPLDGGANIEMGGATSGHVIEYVHSFDPRGWSCLHVTQGPFSNCTNATVQNNDIGPAGSDRFQQWADGISFACQNGLVRNNMINNPTDGGVVLFGAPGTRVENNTIWIRNHTLLGGINLVDPQPYNGNYNGVVVTKNIIAGAFASQAAEGSETKGSSDNDVVIKVGIAIGPRIWFGDKYANNISSGAIVENNLLTGAFSYGIAMSSAKNFTVENNILMGNTSFIGARGPNCSTDAVPSPAAFVIDLNTTTQSTTQFDFTPVANGDNLICVFPPDGGDYWPFGGNPDSSAAPVSPPEPNPSSTSSHHSAGRTAGIVVGSLAAVLVLAGVTYLLRRWAIRRSKSTRLSSLQQSWEARGTREKDY